MPKQTGPRKTCPVSVDTLAGIVEFACLSNISAASKRPGKRRRRGHYLGIFDIPVDGICRSKDISV